MYHLSNSVWAVTMCPSLMDYWVDLPGAQTNKLSQRRLQRELKWPQEDTKWLKKTTNNHECLIFILKGVRGALTRPCPWADCHIVSPCVLYVCFSAKQCVCVCVSHAHVTVPIRSDSYRSERFWEFRVSWLTVRTQWSPSKYLHVQMLVLVGQVHETPKEKLFLSKAKGGLSGLGKWQMNLNQKNWAFIFN